MRTHWPGPESASHPDRMQPAAAVAAAAADADAAALVLSLQQEKTELMHCVYFENRSYVAMVLILK